MVWAILLVVGLSIGSSAQESKGKLKVITYNIWNGFDWGKDEQRRSALGAWVDTQKPDVVALQELCGYTEEKLRQDALNWGHHYSILLKTTGYPVGLTSNKPIELREKMLDGLHHGALHVKTCDIDFLVVHLHPGSFARRREEVKILLPKLREIREGNDLYVVLGDFNAPSPFDADLYDPDGYFLERLRQSNRDRPEKGNLCNGDLDYAVMAAFIAFPLHDACRPFTTGMAERGSFPGRVLGPVQGESVDQLISRLERIDYVMVSPEIAERCTAARVCNGADNWFLSDHYPVVAEFDIRGLE